MNPSPVSYLETGFIWVLETSFHASVLMLFVWAAQTSFRRWLRPRWRYALSLLVLLRLIMPDVPASGFSIFSNWRHGP